MSGKTVKLFELCCKEDDRVWSPFVWRSRLACLHKGLKIESVPWRFTEKDRLKFANSSKVPVLVDGDQTIKESFDIAVYLEKTYPDAPSLFGGPGGEALCRFANNYAGSALGQYFPALLPEIWSKLDKADADYFREDREKRFGGKLEDLANNPPPKDKVKNFREYLNPVRQTLGQQPYLGGDQPSYADYCIVSIILTGKALSKLQLLEKDDPVLAWVNKILEKYADDLKNVIWEW